jgi:ATP-dependent RNA helicase RhlE
MARAQTAGVSRVDPKEHILTSFNELGLAAPLLQALATENYSIPTPIQFQAIPHILAGKDLLGIAQTGTGKTAAFALPMLQRLAADARRPEPGTCRALILSPTRELASQIAEGFKAYGRNTKLSVAVVFGGVSIRQQTQALSRGVDILVATPGRLMDHLDSRTLRLDRVAILVLDEADQMLDMGFIHAIKRIVAKLPKQRQNLFFSATMPRAIAGLADELLRDPARVAVTPVATTVDKVEQSVVFVDRERKRGLLVDLLGDPAMQRVLVFTRTKHGADRVVRHLEGAGIGSSAIHGNKSQAQRERALAAFKSGHARVLIATDIAARGIDVDAVSHVVNFDLPNVPESYVHRIGRTARAGAAGVAISFCGAEEKPLLRDIEKLIRREIPASGSSGPNVPERARAAPPQGRQAWQGAKTRPHGRYNAGERRDGHAPAGQKPRQQAHARSPHGGGGQASSAAPKARPAQKRSRFRPRAAR